MEQEITLNAHNKQATSGIVRASSASALSSAMLVFILFFTVFLTSSNKSYAQYSDSVVSYVNKPFTGNDTLFLDRYTAIVNGDTLTQSRYVIPANSPGNKKRQSDLLLTYANGRWHNECLDIDYIEVFTQQYSPLRHFDLHDFPCEWCHIELYQGKPYHTCDNPFHIFFTDSVVVFESMDWYAGALTSFNKLKHESFSYSFLNNMGDEITETIRPVKNIKGLYIRITSQYGSTAYSLIVPMSQVSQFDCIDIKNWFEISYPYEIEYDKINTLIKDGTIKY